MSTTPNSVNSATTAQEGPNLADAGEALVGDAARWISASTLEILVAAAIGSGIAFALLALRSLACRLIEQGNAELRWRVTFARVISKTSFFFIVMCSAALDARYAETPPALFRVIMVLFTISAALQGAIWARELILGYVEHRVGHTADSTTLGSAIGIIRLLVSVAVFAIALIIILDNIGVNVTGLVAGLGIGGIAIGLAAQGIFSDLFAALSIIFDKPFRRGDGIRFDDISGSVEQIGLKTTRVRSLAGEEVVVSNAQLLSKQIHNFANLHHRRMILSIGVIYQTPPALLARIPDIIGTIIAQHDDATMVRCGITGFGASSVDFELQFDIHSTDFEKVFGTRHSVCIAILKTFAEEGIEFAYPTQTSFTAAPDGRAIMPYPDVAMLATSIDERSGRVLAGDAGPEPADEKGRI